MGQMKSMRLVTLFFVLLMFVLTGCDKSKENKEFTARYNGTFIRTDDMQLGDPIISNVTLSFTKNTFRGSSDTRSYPAICSGTFTISQSKISVSNSCFFTADFDGTLIFTGSYEYEQMGNRLRIWRTYANGKQDIYDLIKEE
jgi:hypothetical protein